MKKVFLFFFVVVFTTASFAQVNMPQPSPTQTIIQNFGMGKIELTYSRPSIKGRTLFAENSELAPTGKMWRTGANAATRLHFTDFVNIGGKDIDSGSYALYTIPGESQWEMILNKGFNNNGLEGYKESDDVVRLKVDAVQSKDAPMETFTMQFQNVKPESCELVLRWGTTRVGIPITTKIQERLRAQIEKALVSSENKPYWQAANFYFEWDKNYPKALENVNKALVGNDDAYFMYMLRAKIEAAMGDKINARADAQKCLELATKANDDGFITQANKLLQAL